MNMIIAMPNQVTVHSSFPPVMRSCHTWVASPNLNLNLISLISLFTWSLRLLSLTVARSGGCLQECCGRLQWLSIPSPYNCSGMPYIVVFKYIDPLPETFFYQVHIITAQVWVHWPFTCVVFTPTSSHGAFTLIPLHHISHSFHI